MLTNNMNEEIKTILFASLIAAMVVPFSGMSFAQAEEMPTEQLIAMYDKAFETDATSEEKIAVMDNILNGEIDVFEKSDEQIQVESTMLTLLQLREQYKGTVVEQYFQQSIDAFKPEMIKYGNVLVEDLKSDPQYWETQIQSARFNEFGISFEEENGTIIMNHGPEDWDVLHTMAYYENGWWRSEETKAEHVDDGDWSHLNFEYPALWSDEVYTQHQVINNSYSEFKCCKDHDLFASYWPGEGGSAIQSFSWDLSYNYQPRQVRDWDSGYSDGDGIEEGDLAYSSMQIG